VEVVGLEVQRERVCQKQGKAFCNFFTFFFAHADIDAHDLFSFVLPAG
jgi:hypothetical protein